MSKMESKNVSVKITVANNLNIKIFDFKILKYIEDYNLFSENVGKLRRTFNFTNTIYIHAFDSIEELSRKVSYKLPKWVVGTSYDNNILVINYTNQKNKVDTFSSLILHEFVHVILATIKKDRLPIWLNEGLAIYFSGQYKKYNFNNIDLCRRTNFYELNYCSNYLYDKSIYILLKLIDKYGVAVILDELFICENFEGSRLFNNNNLCNILE